MSYFLGLGGGPDTWVNHPFNAAEFTGSGAMTWTVQAGDVTSYAYSLNGTRMTLLFELVTTSVGGVLDTLLNIPIPAGRTNAREFTFGGIWFTVSGAGTVEQGFVFGAAGATTLNLFRTNFAVWLASTNDTNVGASITFSVN